MKTKEELNALKEEVKAVNKKLAELSEEELAEVTGGSLPKINPDEKYVLFQHLTHDESGEAAGGTLGISGSGMDIDAHPMP